MNPKTLMMLPTVVHVIHQGEAVGIGSNISDAAILGALDCVNDRFDGSMGSGASASIEFCLASVDPIGAATTGIHRVDGNQFSGYVSEGLKFPFSVCNGPDHYTVAQAVGWPVQQYYNVYLVWDICGNSWIGGFAEMPSGALQYTDGAYITTSMFTCPQTLATHEFGHSMGLYHTFNGENGVACPTNTDCLNQGDIVCDTPPHRSSDCGNMNPCQTDQSDWPNSLHNYMSYCFGLDRFSAEQIVRMRSVISTQRQALVTSGACSGNIGINELSASSAEPVELTFFQMGEDGLEVAASEGMLDIVMLDMLGRTVAALELSGSPKNAYIELPDAKGAHIIRVHHVRGFSSQLVVVE